MIYSSDNDKYKRKFKFQCTQKTQPTVVHQIIKEELHYAGIERLKKLAKNQRQHE